ncbi:MAG: glucose-6-phosphate dehydrogenase [Verrucomicrobia bacterium]|nr:glucose-6-phosphate dehydrogenase [Verrucomicrobiota bacterium]
MSPVAAPAKPKAAATPVPAPAPIAGRVLPPFVMVIFGASGDLTSRKLVPALFGLHHEGILPKDYSIIGFARRPKKDEEFRKEMKEGIDKFSRLRPIQTPEWDKFTPRLTYHQGNFDEPAAYASLKKTLDELAKTRGLTQHIFYLATAPDYFATVVKHLAEAGLVRPGLPARVVVEKPFGNDLKSARQLVDDLQSCLDESNLFRIDHYLGKETVQNLLYFRFANSIWEPIWNSNLIDNVQITVAEQEGVGTRGAFYDEVGAMRDMVQNHMMQLLAITAMEPPANLSSESIRDEKVKVLRSIPTPKPEIIPASTVRAQYEGYRQTDRVSPKSTTETYAAMKLQIDNWRWSGVPFYLRTGKALTTRASEIVIVFRRPPATLFRAEFGDLLHRNAMHIRLQPNEGVHLCFNAKKPGKSSVQPVDMEFCYTTEFGSYSPEAYERLLGDAIFGDSTLFTRADEVLEAWRLVDSIREGWQDTTMALYRQGSWGPHEADLLMQADGNNWVDLDARAKA